MRVHSARGRYHIRWFAEDTGDWHEILDDFKYEFRPHQRRFDGATRTWSVPLDCRAQVRAWASRWFDADSREFTEEEPADHSRSYSYSYSRSSSGRYGEPQSATTVVERAYAEMHLLPSAPPELVQAAHRTLVKIHHPDRGGDTQVMTRINLAMQLIREQAEEKAS